MEEKEEVKAQPSVEKLKETEVESGHSSNEKTVSDGKTVSENAGVQKGEAPEEKGEAPEEKGKAPEQECENSQEVIEDFKSKYLYLAAELENQKKRFQKERESFFRFGSERILGDLIQVVDNLERTIAAIEKDKDEKVHNIVTGINMVKNQFLDTLGRHGLTLLESLGKEFDPSVHEAMAEEESEQESNKIISVFEQGYKLNGRLLRAAKVIVSK